MKRVFLLFLLFALLPACGLETITETSEGCTLGTEIACDSPGNPVNIGDCRAGVRICNGADFDPCVGAVFPSEEVCDLDGHDENCDGVVNEDCACTPGTIEPCYDGGEIPVPKGICHAGTRVCGPDGVFGDCVGAQMPLAEVCNGDLLDEDCDGKVNEGCLCTPGSTTACYEEPEGTPGPDGTEGIGVCKSGMRTCNVQGTEYGPCEEAVLPASEECDFNGLDENCDGQVNESGEDCVCVPDTGSTCDYTGPAGTEDVGLCVAATRTCNALGLDLGTCSGEVVPACESCAAPNASNDQNCDGISVCSSNVGWAANYKALGNRDAFYAVANSRDAQGNFDGGVVLGGDTGGSYTWNGKTITGNYTSPIVVKLDANRNVVWATDLGSGALSVQVVESVAVDSHGDIVVAGRFNVTMSPPGIDGVPITTLVGPPEANPAVLNLFVAKLERATGGALWAKELDTTDMAYPPRVTVGTNDDIWLAGGFAYALYFDDPTPSSACATPDDNLGATLPRLCTTGGHDLFVAKLDSDGIWMCATGAGAAANDLIRDLTVDENGVPIVVGNYTVGSAGVLSLNPGSASPITLNGGGGEDFMVGVVDPSTCLFTMAKGYENNNNNANEGAYAVDYYYDATTATIVVGGTYDGPQLDLGMGLLPASKGAADIFFAGLDRATLSTKWQKSYGSNQVDNLVDLSFGCGGEITAIGVGYATSSLVPTVVYGQTPFVAKLDATGSVIWAESQGTDAAAANPDIIKLFAVATQPLGSAVVVGEMQGNFTLGGAFLSTSYYSDMFLFEIGP